MNRKYKFHDNDKLYFISYATVNWIDLPCRQADVFVREEYFQIIIDSWKNCQEKRGLEIYGWCIMPNHVHLIIGSKKDRFEDIIRDMKKRTPLELKEEIKNNVHESKKEWMLWMMERTRKKNGHNKDWSRELLGATP